MTQSTESARIKKPCLFLISSRIPHAGGKADSMTVFRIIEYFSKRGWKVLLATFFADENELRHLEVLKKLCVDVRTVRQRTLKSVIHIARHLPNSSVPLQVSYFRDGVMQSVVDQMLADHQPDLAYAHLIRTAEYLKKNPDFTGAKVLAMQIAQTLNYRRMIEHIASPFYRLLYRLEYNRVCNYEPDVTKYFDSCLIISEYDKRSLKGHEGIENFFFSPHGIDVEKLQPDHSIPREPHSILFCGVLETPTNIDAVLYFHREIYPKVKRACPEIKFYLLGKNPPSLIKAIAAEDPSVEVTGFVEDLQPYYSKVPIGIAPMRICAGLQNKLLTGMAMAQAMVCTPQANEGIGGIHGKHLLEAHTPDEFADHIIDLLGNPKKAQKIGLAGRKFVQEGWTWEFYFRQLEKHFETLISRKKSK